MILIDAEALAEEYEATDANPSAKLYPWSLQDILKILGEQPAVEVVRCEDCKHSDYYGCANGMVYCMEHSCYMDENGFCSDGEREEI